MTGWVEMRLRFFNSIALLFNEGRIQRPSLGKVARPDSRSPTAGATATLGRVTQKTLTQTGVIQERAVSQAGVLGRRLARRAGLAGRFGGCATGRADRALLSVRN